MTRQTPTPRMTVNCPACGRDYEVETWAGVSGDVAGAALTIGPVTISVEPDVEVERADDLSGWFLTCPPNHLHADPERFAVTREDVTP